MATPPIPAEKRELVFSLLRRGVRVGRIEVESGVSRRTVGRLRASLGTMPRPFDAEYDARYLTREERYEIARLHDGDVSVRQIAVRLQRSPSTGVSDPLCKGVTSNLNRRSGSRVRKRHGGSAGHCRGGTTATGA